MAVDPLSQSFMDYANSVLNDPTALNNLIGNIKYKQNLFWATLDKKWLREACNEKMLLGQKEHGDSKLVDSYPVGNIDEEILLEWLDIILYTLMAEWKNKRATPRSGSVAQAKGESHP